MSSIAVSPIAHPLPRFVAEAGVLYTPIDNPQETDTENDTQPRLPSHLLYAERAASDDRVSHYQAEKAIFDTVLAEFPEDFQEKLRDTLEALRFVDYADVAWDLTEVFQSRGEYDITEYFLQHRYNRAQRGDDPPFRNFQAASQYLKRSRTQESLARLRKVHAITMSDGVDQLSTRSLGKIRNCSVQFETEEEGLTQSQFRAIKANPYLSFPDPERERLGPRKFRYHGTIEYPTLENVSQEVLDRIRETYTELVREVELHQHLTDEERSFVSEQQHARLTQKLITALLEERFQHFQNEKEEIGDLDTAKKVLDYIRLVALHYRDVISIHPFEDGNGRSCRLESLYAPLDTVGVSRPRLNDPDTDILHSRSGWIKEVHRGIRSNDRVYLDIAFRLRLGFRLENSPYLLFPNIPADVGLPTKIGRRKKHEPGLTLVPVDGAQFGAYLDTRLSTQPEMAEMLQEQPIETMEILREEYKDFARSRQCFHRNNGEIPRRVGVELVDLDFAASFGETWAGDVAKWSHKISRWYRPQIIWRGLPEEEVVPHDEEIFRMFRELSAFTICENLLNYWDEDVPHADLVEWVREEFDRYNQEVLSGELAEMARDHVFARHEDQGGRYDESYGLSTSQKWTMARNFAMGALTLDDNMRDFWKRQEELPSRIVIGSLWSRKDVDINRLKVTFPQFSARSGRQAEVMAIGGIDPDSVMAVQRIDPRGRIEKSYLRSPTEPGKIVVVDGGFIPDFSLLRKIPSDAILEEVSIL